MRPVLKSLSIFKRKQEGAVSVEFTFIFPILLVLMLGCVEVPGLLWTRSAVVDSTSVLGDLASRATAVDDASVANMFLASAHMLDNQSGNVPGFEATLSSVITCPCAPGSAQMCFEVIWSHGYKNKNMRAGHAVGSRIDNVPASLAVGANETMIVSEVQLPYDPQISFALDSKGVVLSERMYFRPRRSREVSHVGSFAKSDPSTCD